MKLYRYDYKGVPYAIVDYEDGTPLRVTEVNAAAAVDPTWSIYQALYMIDAWKEAGRPGEVLKQEESE